MGTGIVSAFPAAVTCRSICCLPEDIVVLRAIIIAQTRLQDDLAQSPGKKIDNHC